MHFLVGLGIMAISLTLVLKTEWYMSNFGRIAFFDQHLGVEGGSRLGYKLLGILGIFIGFMIFTGMINGFLEWMLSPLLKHMVR
jgi:hypothetical protein